MEEKRVVENHLGTVYKDLGIGLRKGIKTDITRFINELDEFMMQVGNESFFSTSKDYRDDTILNLADLWTAACKAYFNNEDGKAIYSRFDPNKNLTPINAIIPFGPWIMWSKNEWKDIKYSVKRWKRLQKRSKNGNNTVSTTIFPTNPSQKDRGRRDSRSYRSDDSDKSKSRSRSRKSASSRRRNTSNRKRTSSKSTIIQSSDYADSEASLV